MISWKKLIWPALVCAGLAGLVIHATWQPAPAGEGGGAGDKPGRFQAVPSGGGTVILLDTATGKTWRTQSSFVPFGGGEQVWVPMQKFDSLEAYKKWQAEQDKALFKDKGPPFPPVFDKVPLPFKDKLPFPDKVPVPPFKDKLPIVDKLPPPLKDKLPLPVLDKKLDPFQDKK